MPKVAFSGWRFALGQHDAGGWPVVDNGYVSAATKAPRVVAVCPDRQDAEAILAYFNNDPEGGRRILAEALAQLDHA